jgi:hypothetical protein
MSLLIKAQAFARVEDVTALPAPSAVHSGRIVKLRSGGKTRVYTCVKNSDGSYEWNQMIIST